MNHIKAQRREKKKRQKMAVHGRGIKSQPTRGIPKTAKRGCSVAILCFYIFLFFCFYISPTQAQSEPPPQLFIIAPAPGEVISSSEVKVVVNLSGKFSLTDPKQNPEHHDGEGHLLLWLDAPTASLNEIQENNQGGSVILTEAREYIYKNVFSGLHTLNVEFVRNDNKSYAPKMFVTVNFETIIDQAESSANTDDNTANLSVDLSTVSAGLFLPPGGGNTLLAIILVFIVSGVLWYIFRWKGKHNS